MAKWIKFSEQPPRANRTTKVWHVLPPEVLPGSDDLAPHPAPIGAVSWFGRWRKYCFFPAAETVYEQDCLRDIAAFCEQKTTEHRQDKERNR